MKNIYIYMLLAITLCSCNNVPNRSVFEPLSTNELSNIIKADTMFANFYQSQQEVIDKLTEIDKAKFNDITYRKLYKMYQYASDTTVINPMLKIWNKEWTSEYGNYQTKIDSLLSYWVKYKEDNSLSRLVKVEFAEINKEYYSYGYDVKNVNMGFRLIPLQGVIEQIKFNYRYSAKINDFFGDKNYCISTTPFNSPIVRYWEVDYSNEKKLKNQSTAQFKRDYDILIEITDVRKDGKNYSIADLNIPEVITNLIEADSIRYPYLYGSYKEDAIKELLRPDYKSNYEYNNEKFTELLKNKFPREFLYSEYISKK